MLPNAANILDQLLGGFETDAALPVNQVGQPSPEGSVFANLLGLKLADNGDPLALGAMVPEFPEIGLKPAGDVLQSFELDLQALAVNSEAVTPESADPMAIAEAVVAEQAAESVKVMPGENPAVNVVISESLPQNPNIAQLFNISEQVIEPGVYNVLEANVVDGMVELTIATNDVTIEPIKLVIPAELFEQTFDLSSLEQTLQKSPASALRVAQSRIPLVTPEMVSAAPLESLLSDLNFKSLEIMSDPAKGQGANAEARIGLSGEKQTVIVQLVAEHSGQTLTLKGKLRRDDIEIRSTNKTNGAARPALSQSSTVDTDKREVSSPTSSEPLYMTKPAAAPQKLHRRPMPFELGSQPTTPSGVTPSGVKTSGVTPSGVTLSGATMPDQGTLSALPIMDSDVAKPIFPEVKSESLPVRFSLPDRLAENMRPSGQSVMIKIEPEHLGPARLYLSMRNDTLTARLMVDSPMAKMAIENSLEQLADQLWRAGVEFDKIEVALAGGDAGGQLFDRQSAWSMGNRFRRMNRLNQNETGERSLIESAPITPTAEISMSSAGVDLWA